MSTNAYRAWLVRMVMWLGVADCTRRGYTTLADIRDELLDLGVLDEFERNGDMFMLELYRVGPFYRDDTHSDRFKKFDGAHVDDFAFPGPPPPLQDVEVVEDAQLAVTGKQLPPKYTRRTGA